MPGRPLRRARRTAVATLTAEQAHEVAAIAARHLDRVSAVGVIVNALPRDTSKDVLNQIAGLSLHMARKHAGELAARDQQAARSVVGLAAQHPEVERALGITRRANQQRPT